MTILDLIASLKLAKLTIPFEAPSEMQKNFPATETDTYFSEDGEIFVAVNRVTGRFAAERGETCVVGDGDTELSDEQVRHLSSPE